MNVIKTPIDGLLILKPKVFGDKRGFFFESFNVYLHNTFYCFMQTIYFYHISQGIIPF